MSFLPDKDPLPSKSVTERIALIRDEIISAAQKSGRKGTDVRLVAVTKTVPAALMLAAYEGGVEEFGENKIQEALQKREFFESLVSSPAVIHHFIGSLQTNKAKKAVQLFDLIQSVDRPALAQALDRVAGEMKKTQACLVEIKISDEETKMGLPLEEASAFVQSFSQYKNLRLDGAMTIGPRDADSDELRESFRKVRKFFDEHKTYFSISPVLSMGMSDDYRLAIEEGSTMVRIGRALFGERMR